MAAFRDVLSQIHRKVEGARAVSLIGLDGIAIDSIADDEIPLETLSAEFGSFIKSIRLANTELKTGDVEQFALVTEKYVTFLSSVTADYFILLVIEPQGNYGRARFELRKAKYALRDELS